MDLQGFFGPPPFLKPFVSTDGEASYVRVEAEMFIVVWLLSVASILFFRLRRGPGGQ